MTTLLDAEPTSEPRINKRAVGQRIEEARRRAGMHTREKAAAQLGVDEKSLRAWEEGRWLPGSGTLAVMCKRMGVTMDWVMWGASE